MNTSVVATQIAQGVLDHYIDDSWSNQMIRHIMYAHQKYASDESNDLWWAQRLNAFVWTWAHFLYTEQHLIEALFYLETVYGLEAL